MKFGKQTIGPVTPEQEQLELLMLKHLHKFRLTVNWVWSLEPSLRDFSAVVLSAALHRLTKRGWVAAYPLHHGKFYFVPTAKAASLLDDPKPSGATYSELDKLKAYARLIYFVRHRSDCKPLTPVELAQCLGSDAAGLPNGFYGKLDEPGFLGFLRIDSSLMSSPARASQAIRSDIFRFVKVRAVIERIKRQQFELTFITATQYRADAILARFRSYDRVGTTPINMVVIPELVPLLTSVPIDHRSNGNTS